MLNRPLFEGARRERWQAPDLTTVCARTGWWPRTVYAALTEPVALAARRPRMSSLPRVMRTLVSRRWGGAGSDCAGVGVKRTGSTGANPIATGPQVVKSDALPRSSVAFSLNVYAWPASPANMPVVSVV